MREEMQTRGADARVADIAGRQHGVVGRSQLLRLGLGSSAIGRRVDAGRLHPVHRGVYAVGHRVLSKEGRWMAAVLASGPGAVLSHRSAAALWGIRPATRAPVEVIVASKSRSSRRIHRHCVRLPPDEITVERGIPVTTVPRTILDLAAVGPVDQVESALRQSEYLRLHDRLSLQDLLERYPGHRGARSAGTALARRTERPGRTRSPLEERFLPLLDRHGLPRPRLNAWLQIPGGMAQVDCFWSESMNVVELDGWAGHGTRVAFREDRARDRRLRVAGYGVTRISWAQLDDEPLAVAADLRSLLQHRSSPTGTTPDRGLR